MHASPTPACRLLAPLLWLWVGLATEPMACAADAGVPGPAALRLVASVRGKEYTRVEQRNDTVVVLDDIGTPVDGPRQWRIDGDPRTSGNVLVFDVSYAIAPRNPVIRSFDERHALQVVPQMNRGVISDVWPQDYSREAIAVFAWVVDGRIVRVSPVALPRDPETWWTASSLLDLTSDEARGAPVVLLWRNDRFLEARRSYDVRLHDALVAMHFDSDSAFEQAVRDLPSLLLRRRAARLPLIHTAAQGGFLNPFRILVHRGVPIDLDNDGNRPLKLAARQSRETILAEIQAHPTRRADAPPPGMDVAVPALIRRGALDAAAGLLDAYNGWDRWSGIMDTFADYAARSGRTDLLERLVQHGKAAAIRDVSAGALIGRVLANDRLCLEFLLHHGADVRRDHFGTTALHAAAGEGHSAIVALLLAHRARPDTADRMGRTPLMLAARRGDSDTCALLLRAGAETSRDDESGLNAVGHAILSAFPETLAVLIEHDPSLVQRKFRKMTPLDFALQMRSRGCARVLADRAAPFDARHVASLEGAVALDLVELLERATQAGWNPDSAPTTGLTWLTVAETLGSPKVADWLRSRGIADSTTRIRVVEVPAPVVSPFFEGGARIRLKPVQIRVRAVLNVDKSWSFPVLLDAEHDVGPEIIYALRGWQPQLPDETSFVLPVAAEFMATLPATDRRVHPVEALDREPQPIGRHVLLSVQNRVTQIRQTRVEPIPGGGFTTTQTTIPVVVEQPFDEAIIELIVEPDGTIVPTDIMVPASDPADPTLLLDRLQFTAPRRDGIPVRARMLYRIANR